MSTQTVPQPTEQKPAQQQAPAQGSQSEQQSQNVQQSNQAPVKTNDLLKRISSEPQKQETSPAQEEPLYNSSDIEKIQDPMAKKVVQDLYKHFEKGFNKKFMEVADKEKAVSQRFEELQRQQDWTPERVQQILQDPRFVASAQTLAQSQAPGNWTGTSEEWSALNPTEKAAFQQLEGKVNSLLASNNKMLVAQYDNQIKTKYSDYDPTQIDKFAEDFDRGAVDTATLRELMHKALNFERYMERTYQFGMHDGHSQFKEKLNGSTEIGTGALNAGDDKPKMEPGEKPGNYFKRLAMFNLQKQKQGALPRK